MNTRLDTYIYITKLIYFAYLPAQYDISGDVIETVRLVLAKRAPCELGRLLPSGAGLQ